MRNGWILTATIVATFVALYIIGIAVLFPIFGVMALFVTIAFTRGRPFLCPRCAKPFGSIGAYNNGFTRRCLHCGLAVDTPKSSDGGAPGAG